MPTDQPPLPYRPREHFEQMAARVLEVKTAATIPRVDPVRLAAERVRPVSQFASPNAREDLVEFLFTDQERVMLDDEFLVRFEEMERSLFAVCTPRNGPKGTGETSPRISAMNSAATRLSRA